MRGLEVWRSVNLRQNFVYKSQAVFKFSLRAILKNFKFFPIERACPRTQLQTQPRTVGSPRTQLQTQPRTVGSPRTQLQTEVRLGQVRLGFRLNYSEFDEPFTEFDERFIEWHAMSSNSATNQLWERQPSVNGSSKNLVYCAKWPKCHFGHLARYTETIQLWERRPISCGSGDQIEFEKQPSLEQISVSCHRKFRTCFGEHFSATISVNGDFGENALDHILSEYRVTYELMRNGAWKES